ncbi:hypothetical protein [Brevundimonas sp. LjRoot202]|uniref:hypothetical protein n=1 Tax=Brevundimonas sp. LjRoot202 TaxID=3342281 RepID=UPI003ED14D4B
MNFRIFDPSRWAILGAVVLLLILAVFVIGRCTRGDDLKQAKGDAALADGRTTSAVEAITQIGELGQRADATDAQVKEAQDAIRQADPADRDRVFRHRVCLMQHRPGCDRLLGVGAGSAADPDASR